MLGGVSSTLSSPAVEHPTMVNYRSVSLPALGEDIISRIVDRLEYEGWDASALFNVNRELRSSPSIRQSTLAAALRGGGKLQLSLGAPGSAHARESIAYMGRLLASTDILDRPRRLGTFVRWSNQRAGLNPYDSIIFALHLLEGHPNQHEALNVAAMCAESIPLVAERDRARLYSALLDSVLRVNFDASSSDVRISHKLVAAQASRVMIALLARLGDLPKDSRSKWAGLTLEATTRLSLEQRYQVWKTLLGNLAKLSDEDRDIVLQGALNLPLPSNLPERLEQNAIGAGMLETIPHVSRDLIAPVMSFVRERCIGEGDPLFVSHAGKTFVRTFALSDSGRREALREALYQVFPDDDEPVAREFCSTAARKLTHLDQPGRRDLFLALARHLPIPVEFIGDGPPRSYAEFIGADDVRSLDKAIAHYIRNVLALS